MPLPLVGGLVAALSRLFSSRIGMWVVAGIAFLGIEFAASTFVMEPFMDKLQDTVSGLPATVSGWVGYLNVDRYMSILLSAYVVAAAKGALSVRKKAA